jgi:small nuclear ribonucleoprotein (snRNP)-like protein
MQYPLHLLKLGEGSNIMVELKSGETYNGTIKGVDKFTNIKIEAANLSDKVLHPSYRMGRSSTV